MRPMAVPQLVRSLWWAQPADASWARVVRVEARAPVCGRHSEAAYVADSCKNLVCMCAMCGADEASEKNVWMMSVCASERRVCT